MLLKNKSELLILLCLSCVYALTRLSNLTIIPIFGDEAIYLNWAQSITENIRQLFIPLSDGKQPLHMWLTALLTYVVPNPLWAPRLISVIAGFFSMLGIYQITACLVNKRAAQIAALIYILTPIFFFYDRLGVPDGLLATFGIWTLYFGIRLFENPTLYWMAATGMTLGLGLLTKSPAIFYFLLLPTIAFIKPKQWWKDKQAMIKIALNLVGAYFIGLAIVSILRISALYPVIAQRTDDFVFSPMHLLKEPLNPFLGRIGETGGWIIGYLTLPLVLLGIFGFIYGFARKWLVFITLLCWFLIPLLLEMALAKGFTPRYFLFTLPPVIIAAAYGLYVLFARLYLKYQYAAYAVFLLLIPASLFILQLITNPVAAPIPQKERSGYLEDWTAGHGIKEVIEYVRALPKEHTYLIGTEGTFGTLPDGLIIYNRKSSNIRVEGLGQPAAISTTPPDLWKFLLDEPTGRAFLVVNRSRMQVPYDEYVHLKLIEEYPKATGPDGQDSLLFYEITR